MLINKGNPMLMGCSRYKDGYNFTYEAECDNAALLIFDVHMKLKERIELDSSMKCGNIFSVHVSGKKLDKCFYCYEIDGLMYALLTVIIIDYITGTICAIVNKKLCSKNIKSNNPNYFVL